MLPVKMLDLFATPQLALMTAGCSHQGREVACFCKRYRDQQERPRLRLCESATSFRDMHQNTCARTSNKCIELDSQGGVVIIITLHIFIRPGRDPRRVNARGRCTVRAPALVADILGD